jgi:hypothetical protein
MTSHPQTLAVKTGAYQDGIFDYLTIIRRRRGDIIGEYSPRRSRGEYSPIITEPEANNCFSIFTQAFVFF